MMPEALEARTPAPHPQHERDQERDEEQEEQDLGDACGARGDAAEAKNRGEDGNDEERRARMPLPEHGWPDQAVGKKRPIRR
jgi:hypothetical protein